MFEAIAQMLPHVDEVVVLDAASSDGTPELMRTFNPKIRVVDNGPIQNTNAFFPYDELATKVMKCCQPSEKLLKFDADQVWDTSLIESVIRRHERWQAVWRVQVDHNLQRVKQYPWLFTMVVGEPCVTHSDNGMVYAPPGTEVIANHDGYVWDVSGNFLDGEHYGAVPTAVEAHSRQAVGTYLNVPPILRGLVGMHKYRVRDEVLSLLR